MRTQAKMDSIALAAVAVLITVWVRSRRSKIISKLQLVVEQKNAKSQTLAHQHNPLIALQGEGSYLIDEHGMQYLDSRNNVAILGHQHPAWVELVCKQLYRTNTNARYLHPLRNELASKLCATLPTQLNVCFFVNSGSEATELALRLAHAKSKQSLVVAVENGYHGVTLAAMRASPYKWQHQRPKDLLVVRMDEDVSKAVGDASISCFIVESALSVGGVLFSKDVNWLSKSFHAIRARGGVCICDEVQVGLGRTGKWFWAFQRDPLCMPDIITIGKGLGNGFPVAAVVCTREIADALDDEQREVFSTFGGNPVACQAAIAVLDTIANEHLQAQALRVGNKLKLAFQNIAFRNPHCITEVRGEGMFLGVCFTNPQVASAVSQRMYDNHRVLTSCDAHVMVIKPPLCWGDEQVEEFCVALETSIM